MDRERLTLDQRPGSLPDIRSDRGGITFIIAQAGPPQREPLVIRCDTDGEIWLSIRPAAAPSDSR
jgi:hypothetical protein